MNTPDINKIAHETAKSAKNQLSTYAKDYVHFDGNVAEFAYVFLARLEQEGWKLMPKEETEKMQDSVRGILQCLRNAENCTEDTIFKHSVLAGYPVCELNVNYHGHITEARAAAMIYRTMWNAAPKIGGTE